MNRKKKIDKSNWVLVSHCLWKYIKRIVSFWMIYLSSERIFLGKRRLVLPILVNERLPQVSFRSGAYVSNNHFAKLSFSHIRYISTSFKGVPCSTCHLARLRKRQKKKKNGHTTMHFRAFFKSRLFRILMVQSSHIGSIIFSALTTVKMRWVN